MSGDSPVRLGAQGWGVPFVRRLWDIPPGDRSACSVQVAALCHRGARWVVGGEGRAGGWSDSLGGAGITVCTHGLLADDLVKAAVHCRGGGSGACGDVLGGGQWRLEGSWNMEHGTWNMESRDQLRSAGHTSADAAHW